MPEMNKKGPVIILIVLGVLSVLTFTIPRDSKEEDVQSSDWLDFFDSALNVFKPKLDKRRVTIKGSGCKKQKIGNTILLQSTCNIKFEERNGVGYQNAELEFPREFVVKVYDKEDENVVCKDSDPSDPDVDKRNTILVSYMPEGESIPNLSEVEKNVRSVCWTKQDDKIVKLVVFEKGGDLRINCLACKEQGRNIEINLD
jgi:hypothetical protein